MYLAAPSLNGSSGLQFGYGFGAAANAAVRRLQLALNALAAAKNDASIRVTADGITGPRTATAANTAVKKYAPSAGRGTLTAAQLPAVANQLAAALEGAARSGPAGMLKTAISKVTTATKAAAAAAAAAPVPRPGGASVPAAKVPASTGASAKADVHRLQAALGALGARVGNATLRAVKADGLMGPKTTAAANLALAQYVPNAAPALRTGRLSQLQVSSQAGAIAMLVEAAMSGAPAAPSQQTASAATSVKEVQAAVVALGKRTGDKTLAIAADGKMGPKTAAAVNKALAKYATIAAPGLRTGALTQAQIIAQAGPIRSALEAAGGASGGAPVGPYGPALPPTTNAVIQELQKTVSELGTLVKDKALVITADGKIGPKTATAINRALTKWVQGLPPNMTTGRLTTTQISQMATTIKGALLTELERRQNAVPFGPVPAPINTTGNVIKDLQLAIASVGKVLNDKALAIKADGKMGPKTTAAANRALSKHARQAPAFLRTGKLTQLDVANQAPAIVQILSDEIGTRGAVPAQAAAVAAQEALPPGEAQTYTDQVPGGLPADLPISPGPDMAPVPTPVIPSPAPGIITPPSDAGTPYTPGGGGGGGGGGMLPSDPGGGGAMPGEAPPEAPADAAAAAPAGFNWKPYAIGAGIIGVAGLLAYAFTRNKQPQRAAPPARRYTAAAYAPTQRRMTAAR